MRNYLILFLLLAGVLQLEAQQDPQYTQFMFNKLAYNPGYAGSGNGPCITALYRNQWIGLEGAPVTQTLSIHTPIRDNRVGIGLNIIHDNIGPSDTWNVGLNYAYRLPLEEGTLGIGIVGNIYRYQVNFSNEILTNPGDNLVQAANETGLFPNIGIGLYYEQDKYYIGVSVPHIIRNDISLLPNTFVTSNIQSRKELHAFAMAGLIVDLTDDIKLKPAAILKYATNSPFDLDINLSLLLYNKISAGLSYRVGGSTVRGFGESIDLVVQFMPDHGITIGAAFDFTLSDLADYNSGSFEIMGKYCISQKHESVANPRFF